MDVIAWIVIGGIVGWLASLVVQGTGLGLLGDIIVGIIGGFVGGAIIGVLSGSGVNGFNIASLVLAFIGAVVLLLLVRLYRRGGWVSRRV